MSEHIMEKLTMRPLNDVSEKLSKRANEHEVRVGTLLALTERCNRLEAENAKLRACLGNNCADCAVGMSEYADSICDQIKAENAKLRELLSMYMTLAGAVASGIKIQNAYADGMGRMLNEAEMRECAMELGIEWCR